MLIQSSHINCHSLSVSLSCPLRAPYSNYQFWSAFEEKKKWRKKLLPFSSSEFQIYGKSVTVARHSIFLVCRITITQPPSQAPTLSSAFARLHISNIWGTFLLFFLSSIQWLSYLSFTLLALIPQVTQIRLRMMCTKTTKIEV